MLVWSKRVKKNVICTTAVAALRPSMPLLNTDTIDICSVSSDPYKNNTKLDTAGSVDNNMHTVDVCCSESIPCGCSSGLI